MTSTFSSATSAYDLPEPPVSVTRSPTRYAAKVQLGRGTAWHADALRLDVVDSFGVELTVRPDRLPLDAGAVQTLIVDGVIEQHDDERVRGELLPYWASLLQSGGELIVICKDVDAAVEKWRDGSLS